MGEYASFNGEQIKIGTCEDMLYLRPDQIDLVQADVLRDLAPLRFRFPFPQEDNVKPGAFDNPDRGFAVRVEPPAEADDIHNRVQFAANAGVLVSLPCPYSKAGRESGLTYMYNGFQGPSLVVQQRAWAGTWATVMRCAPCGGLWRLGDLAAALPVIEALVVEGDRRSVGQPDAGRSVWHEMALRVRRGYATPVGRSV